MEIFLVRHGQSESNAGLTNHLDSPLTEIGREQARITGKRLANVGLTRAYVSPLRRTLETMRPICQESHLQAEVYADVCEYFSANYPGYKTFPGLTPVQIQQQFPFVHLGQTFPCSDAWWPHEFEDDDRLYERAIRVRDALLSLYAESEERLVIVSHAETVGRLTEAFLRIPPDPEGPPWSDNCGITQFQIPPDASQPALLITQNDVSHLTSVMADATR